MKPRETLSAFDRYLAARGLRFEGIVVGGAALNLLGVVLRPTKDCDVVHPTLPEEIQQDLNPDWPAHVRAPLADLGKRLGHAL